MGNACCTDGSVDAVDPDAGVIGLLGKVVERWQRIGMHHPRNIELYVRAAACLAQLKLLPTSGYKLDDGIRDATFNCAAAIRELLPMLRVDKKAPAPTGTIREALDRVEPAVCDLAKLLFYSIPINAASIIRQSRDQPKLFQFEQHAEQFRQNFIALALAKNPEFGDPVRKDETPHETSIPFSDEVLAKAAAAITGRDMVPVVAALAGLTYDDEQRLETIVADRIGYCGLDPEILVWVLSKDPKDHHKELIVMWLGYLARDSNENGSLIARQGVIPILLSLLHESTSTGVKEAAAWALGCLCYRYRPNQNAVVEKGGIGLLLSLVDGGTTSERQEAVRTLKSLVLDNYRATDKVKIALDNRQIERNCARLGEDDLAAELGFTVPLQNLGTDPWMIPAPVEDQLKAVPETDVRSATPDEVAALVDQLLDAVTDEAKETAMAALTSAAQYNHDIQSLIAQRGAISPLVSVLRDGTPSQQQLAAETLCSLIDGRDESDKAFDQNFDLQVIVRQLRSGLNVALEMAALALGYRGRANNETQAAIAREGATRLLVGLVQQGPGNAPTSAIKALGLLGQDNSDNQMAIAGHGGLEALMVLLRHGTSLERRLATFALDLIAFGCSKNQNHIVQLGGITDLVALGRDGDLADKELAARALLAVAPGNQKAIFEAGGMMPVLTLLNEALDPAKVVAAWTLCFLTVGNTDNQNAFSRAGGYALLLELSRNGNTAIEVPALWALGDAIDDHGSMINPAIDRVLWS